jgi:cob(I)alamin adenosyltransferase
MVLLTRIYTRTGDKGKTSLGQGKRVFKDDLRIEAMGTIDEVNACIGLVRLHTEGVIDQLLSRIQNDLFDIGADLCMPMEDKTQENPVLRIIEEQVSYLEQSIDEYNEHLSPLKSFVLPGGTASSAYIHLARTVTRRAERLLVGLSQKEDINAVLVRYINRLSDLFFVLGRYLNQKGEGDVLWIPGANR